MRAFVLALKERMRARWHSHVYRDYFDLSMAVAWPKGLTMRVLRNTEVIRLGSSADHVDMAGDTSIAWAFAFFLRKYVGGCD